MKQIKILGFVVFQILLLPLGACGKRPIKLTHLPAPWPMTPAETSATSQKSTKADNTKNDVQIWYTPYVRGENGFIRWDTSDGEFEVLLDSSLVNAPLFPLKKILLAQSLYRNNFDLIAKNFPVGFLHFPMGRNLPEKWQQQWSAKKNRPASGRIHLELTIDPGDQEFTTTKDSPPLLSLYRYNPKLQTFHLLATDFLKDSLLNPYFGRVSVNERYYFDAKNIKTDDLRLLLENQEQLFFAWSNLATLNPPDSKDILGFCFQNNLQVNCFNVSKTLTADKLIHRLTSDYQLIAYDQLENISDLSQPQGEWNFWQPATQEEKEMDQWVFGTRQQPIKNYFQNFEHYPFLVLLHTSYLQLMDKLSLHLQKEERFPLRTTPTSCQIPTLGKLDVFIEGSKKVPIFQENIPRPLVFSSAHKLGRYGIDKNPKTNNISYEFQGLYTEFVKWQSIPLVPSDLLFSIGGSSTLWALNQWITIDPLVPVPQTVQFNLVESLPVKKSIGFQRWDGPAPSNQLKLQMGSLSQETQNFPIEVQGQIRCQSFTRF